MGPGESSCTYRWCSRRRTAEDQSTSRTKELQGSTNQQSWCILVRGGVLEPNTREYRRKLAAVSEALGKGWDGLTVSPVVFLHVQLAESKVAQCNVTCVIQQDVFWLKISVDDVETVQTF